MHYSKLQGAEEWYTIVGAAAHSVTFDAGRASPFFAIDDRHSGVVDGRMRSWVLARGSCAVVVQGLRAPTEISAKTNGVTGDTAGRGKRYSGEEVYRKQSNQWQWGIVINGEKHAGLG